MALRPDRNIVEDSITYFMFDTAERGGVVVSTSGTGGWPNGNAMDSADRRAEYVANPSGRAPLGILANDVVNIDQSRQMLNPYKAESQVGDKVTIYTKGWVVTNSIMTGQASGIAVPAPAYVGVNGNLCSTAAYHTASGFPLVGRFLTNIDENGYAVVEVNLP